MIKIYSIAFLIVTCLCSTITVSAQCDFSATTTICDGKPATLLANCEGHSIGWYVNGAFLGNGPSLTYTFLYEVAYQVRMDWADAGLPGHGSITHTIYAGETPYPTLAANPSSSCDLGSSGAVSITNTDPTVSYIWTSTPGGYLGAGTSKTFSNLTSTTEFKVIATKDQCSSEQVVSVEVMKTEAQPLLDPSMPYHKRILLSSVSSLNLYWQSSDDGGANGESMTHSVIGDNYIVTREGDYYIRAHNIDANCWTIATGPVHATMNYAPPIAQVLEIKRAGYNEFILTNDDKDHVLTFADYYWVKNTYANPEIIEGFIVNNQIVDSKIHENGTYYLKGKDRVTGTWGTTKTLNVQMRGDNGLNWIHTKVFDGTASETTVSESKSYFDESGKALQSQTKNLSGNRVFASQSLTDTYDRVVGSTLPAPIIHSDFAYTGNLLLDSEGNTYGADDFDTPATKYNPNPVGDQERGTVGWYYSEQNTLEPLVGKTDFPYTRIENYEDGTGEVRRSAGAGNEHRLGAGHEVLSGTFPVYGELNDYLLRRVVALGIGSDGSLRNEGVQSVSRDENGRYAISIADKSGKGVLTARAGSQADNVLAVQNVVTSNLTEGSVNFRKMTYFYILENQSVSISGSNDFIVENIVTGEQIDGETFASPNNMLAGFYRIILNSGETELTYTNYFLDVSYQFYDDIGRLKSSVSPNGFKKWKENSDPLVNYPTIDRITYEYNFRGWLLSTTEPDAGTSLFKYRKDGKIRFSQNAQQAYENKFSYTHYDAIGRPIESGEYKGTGNTFINLPSQLELTCTAALFPAVDTKDWIKTSYDFADNNFSASTGLEQSQFVQEFLRGAVSYTENENTKTWYSYDQLGRVTWMAQQPKALNIGVTRVFVTTYEYDFLGSVLNTASSMYLNGVEQNKFFHHYAYDADKRLSTVYTSLDGTTKKMRASYTYYLHGPLKRIELGGKIITNNGKEEVVNEIQGIDFVYNINGWLTQINHPEKSLDPGGDNNDAFGMVLDYYESTLSNLFQASLNPSAPNPNSYHSIPAFGENTEGLFAYGTNPVYKATELDWVNMVKDSMKRNQALYNTKEQTSAR